VTETVRVMVCIFSAIAFVTAATTFGKLSGDHHETARMCLQHKHTAEQCARFTETWP